MKLMEAGILVVDDNREMCSLVQNICRQEGFNRVEAAFSSREAESMVGGGGVDLIILDVNLPADKACTGTKADSRPLPFGQGPG